MAMLHESTGKQMSLSQFSGHIGEYKTLLELARTGGSVNLVTGSDEGIDILYQAPAQLIDTDRLPQRWDITAQTVNIQVKNSLSSDPSFTIDKQWSKEMLKRAQFGYPILFLCPGQQQDGTDIIYLLDPKDIVKTTQKSINAKRDGTQYTRSRFLTLIELWAQYPFWMAEYGLHAIVFQKQSELASMVDETFNQMIENECLSRGLRNDAADSQSAKYTQIRSDLLSTINSFYENLGVDIEISELQAEEKLSDHFMGIPGENREEGFMSNNTAPGVPLTFEDADPLSSYIQDLRSND